VKSMEGDLWPVRKFIGFPDDDSHDGDSNLPNSGTKNLKCMSCNWIFRVVSLYKC